MAKDPGRLRAQIGFRSICPADDAFLFRLYASTRVEELAPLDWDERQKDEFLAQQFRAQHESYQARFPGAEYLVVLFNGEPAGRLYVHRGEDEVRLLDIALLPEFRGTGIGSLLLGDLLEEAAVARKPVRIHVERFNPAIRFYERLGFSITGDTGVYYLMEWAPPTTD